MVHEGTLKKLDEKAIEEPALVSSVEARLANLREITEDADDVGKPADKQDDADKPTPDGDDGQKADDQNDADKSTPVEPKDGEGKEAGQEDKELPPAFLRAAVHRGWDEKDAKEFFESNPDAALKTFQNCYMDVNNASREWALLGKAKMQKLGVTNEPPQPKEFKGVDVDALKEEYDLDDKTVEVLKNQNAQLEEAHRQKEQQPVQQVAGPDPNLELQLENFFGSETLKDYGEFYGSVKVGQNWDDLSSGQRSNRWEVLKQANLMAVGADSMGQKMDLIDVLERAHMVVGEPVRERVTRERIKKDVTKRSKSITLKPSDGSRSASKVATNAEGSARPRNRAELIEATQGKLNHLFN